MDTTDPLTKAIRAYGSAGGLAAACGASPQAISHWRHRRIPVEHCPTIEHVTGVRCEELRPDVAWRRVPDENWLHGKPLLDLMPA